MLKSEIRALFKEKRKGLSFFEINRISKNVSTLILEKFDFRSKNVCIFLPIEKQKEFDSYPLIDELIIQGSFPIVSKSNFEDSTLTLFRFEGSEQIEINAFGIPEPTIGISVSETDLDVVFVPFLAIDKEGNRVGYGKGFYDKLLAKCRVDCVFIGISLFDEFVEITDINSFDVPLHCCFTPERYYEFRQ